MRSFGEFIGGKRREGSRQLHLVQKVLERGGFRVESFLDEQFADPYIYCHNPDRGTSFGGVRVYKIGDAIAYRVQRESKTHPYGAAYPLDLDGIFGDLMGDGATKKEQLGEKVMEEVVRTFRAFFRESAKAEKEEDKWDAEDGGLGAVAVRNPMGGDYSSQIAGNK